MNHKKTTIGQDIKNTNQLKKLQLNIRYITNLTQIMCVMQQL